MHKERIYYKQQLFIIKHIDKYFNWSSDEWIELIHSNLDFLRDGGKFSFSYEDILHIEIYAADNQYIKDLILETFEVNLLDFWSYDRKEDSELTRELLEDSLGKIVTVSDFMASVNKFFSDEVDN